MDNDSIEVLRDGIRQYNAIIKTLSNRILELECENSRLRSLLTDRRECVDQVSMEIRDILAAYATPEQLARIPSDVHERILARRV